MIGLLPAKFREAFQAARSVQGWLAEREAWLLYAAALGIPEDGLIVEIGSYRGRSTTLLAESGRRLIAIDPLIAGWGEGNNMLVDECVGEKFGRIVDSYPNLSWLREHAQKVVVLELPQPIDLLYIDGDHIAPAPLEDFNHLRPILAAGAKVAFHDYPSQPGVKAAVEELEKKGILNRIATAGGLYLGKIDD